MRDAVVSGNQQVLQLQLTLQLRTTSRRDSNVLKRHCFNALWICCAEIL